MVSVWCTTAKEGNLHLVTHIRHRSSRVPRQAGRYCATASSGTHSSKGPTLCGSASEDVTAVCVDTINGQQNSNCLNYAAADLTAKIEHVQNFIKSYTKHEGVNSEEVCLKNKVHHSHHNNKGYLLHVFKDRIELVHYAARGIDAIAFLRGGKIISC